MGVFADQSEPHDAPHRRILKASLERGAGRAAPHAVSSLHGLFIELKTVKGRVSPEQREWLNRLCNQGYAAVVCRELDESFDTITRYVEGRFAPDYFPNSTRK